MNNLTNDNLSEILQQIPFTDISKFCQTSRQLANFCGSERGKAIIKQLSLLYQVDNLLKIIEQDGISLEDILYRLEKDTQSNLDLISQYQDIQKFILNRLLQNHPKIIDQIIVKLKTELIRRAYIIPYYSHLQTESRFNDKINFIINSMIGLEGDFIADEIFRLILNIDINLTQELYNLYYLANKEFLLKHPHLLPILKKYVRYIYL